MYKVVSKQILSSGIQQVDVQAEHITTNYQPGQFILVVVGERTRRLMITTFDFDYRRGVILLFINDKTSDFELLANMKIGEEIHTVAGPFGRFIEVEPKNTILCLAEGMHVASLMPLCRYWKAHEVKVISMIQFANKKEMTFESKFRVSCEKVFAASRDDRIQTEGFWRNLDEQIKKKPHCIYIDGSLQFIKKICDIVGEQKIRIIANVLYVWSEFFEPHVMESVEVGGKIFYPFVDGMLIDGNCVDWAKWVEQYQEYQEQQKWLNSRSLFSQPIKESGIFPKLLSGLTSGRQ